MSQNHGVSCTQHPFRLLDWPIYKTRIVVVVLAEALLGRAWVGDAGVALRDCDTALVLDPGLSRAHLRRIHALQQLGQYQVGRWDGDSAIRRDC